MTQIYDYILTDPCWLLWWLCHDHYALHMTYDRLLHDSTWLFLTFCFLLSLTFVRLPCDLTVKAKSCFLSQYCYMTKLLFFSAAARLQTAHDLPTTFNDFSFLLRMTSHITKYAKRTQCQAWLDTWVVIYRSIYLLGVAHGYNTVRGCHWTAYIYFTHLQLLSGPRVVTWGLLYIG